MSDKILSIREKALQVNLEPDIYGTFAEIGAGQEVVRYFFQAGAASGTIASTISAYDMAFSDYVYGKAKRYVCEERVHQMLDIEFKNLDNVLKNKRDPGDRLFTYANTVSALNYFKNNETHGWMGIKFRSKNSKKNNTFILHIRMLDDNNLSQQQAVGCVGVNMIHAAFFLRDDPKKFVASLMDNISNKRIEIDMIKVAGPDFEGWDNRILSLLLVKNAFTPAVLFDEKGDVLQPSEVFYKKDILLLRGSFRPPTYVNEDMIKTSEMQFEKELGKEKNNSLTIMNITLANLKSTGQGDDVNDEDFLARVDLLGLMGQKVLITLFTDYYKLNNYFARFKNQRIRFIMGIYNLITIMDESNHDHLEGGILEAFGRVFSRDAKLYVYPHKEENGVIRNCYNFEYPQHLLHLYNHLAANGLIVPLENYNPAYFSIWSRTVLKMIQKGQDGWEEMVPKKVAKHVKDKCLFGYPCPPDKKAMLNSKKTTKKISKKTNKKA